MASQALEHNQLRFIRWWVVCLWLCLFFALPSSGFARDSSPQARITHWIYEARQAYAQGKWRDVKRALTRAEGMLQRNPKMPPHVAANLTLWLHLLWSKFHRMQALLPPIVQVGALETKAQLIQHQAQLKQAQRHLKRGLFHLTRYNVLFRTVTRRIKVKEAITLVNTRSQEGILRNRVAIVSLRLLRLQRILKEWKVRKQRLTRSTARDRKTRRGLKKIRAMQLKLQKMLNQQARVFRRSEKVYDTVLQDINRRKQGGQVLTWIGIGSLAFGGVAMIAGMICHIESEAWAVPDERKKLSSADARVAKDAGTGLLVGGGVTMVFGTAMWLVGHYLSPSKQAAFQGVYKSHKHYLDWEDKRPKRDSEPAPANTSLLFDSHPMANARVQR